MTLNPAQFANKEAPVHYWAEHANMPGRPLGMHAYTRADSIKGALENIHHEIKYAEDNGSSRVPDGNHHITVMRYQEGAGEPKKAFTVGHAVENGKTTHYGSAFIPDLRHAISKEQG